MSKSGNKSSRITLSDVAKHAGVSVQTASHVLTGNPTVRISEATRARVAESAKILNYRPNRLAQAMKRGRTDVLGVWMPVDRPNITYLRWLKAISERSRDSGYELMITALDSTMAFSARGHIPTIWPVDGIISIDSGRAMRLLREDSHYDSLPLSIIGNEIFSNADSVTFDIPNAVGDVVRSFLAQGRRKIVHVTADWVYRDFPREQRRKGFTEALEAAGIEPIIVSVEGEDSTSAYRDCTRHLRENGVPDAIFGFTDSIAVGAARALLDYGASIPGDCAVWGYGDFPESSDFRIPLSSIAMPFDGVLRQSWEWLIERLGDHSIDSRFANIPMHLVERESSRGA
ncbi:MAG: LacI family DNA-binding transcriptional regulator [Armatimonadetes bacterium]|nr:LacI family DNA-binding transcriptional regulator [Armatimonadota bacterium]